jgi:protein arginine kinase
MKDNSKLSDRLAAKNPWSHNSNAIWLTSALSLSRNLEKFKFPASLAADGRKQTVAILSRQLQQSPYLQNPSVLRAEECSPVDKEFLFEHFLATQSFYQAHSGEAFAVDDSGEFVAIINLPDHLQLVLSDTKGELENALGRLIKIDVHLGQKLSFAFSPRFGYLTANPMHCGTGLVVQVFLQLPALVHRNLVTQIVAKYKTEGITVTGLQGGPPHEHIGDLLVVSNSYCLGVTEDQIVSSVRIFATQMIAEEKRVRTRIKQQNDPEIKDKISRAFGLLTYSYQIEAAEALNALSMLKMGVDLGWVENITVEKLNELLFNSRRAHLLANGPVALRPDELAHHRAGFLHEALQEAKLKTDG